MIELLITLVVGGLLIGAALTILSSQIALYTVQGAKLETQVSLRTGAGMLSWALQELSATGGDLTTLGTHNVTIRAVHAAGIVCAQVGQWFGIYDVSGQFATSDSVLAYNIEDESWVLLPPVSNAKADSADVASNTSNCFWGDTTSAPVPEVAIDFGTTGGVLDSLMVGAPIRAFHTVAYNLEEVDGRYWLVQRVSGAINPELLAGPLLSPADSGLVFHYYDVTGAETATPSEVASIEVLLKAESREDMSNYVGYVSGNGKGGASPNHLADTLRLRVGIRGN